MNITFKEHMIVNQDCKNPANPDTQKLPQLIMVTARKAVTVEMDSVDLNRPTPPGAV